MIRLLVFGLGIGVGAVIGIVFMCVLISSDVGRDDDEDANKT